MRAQLFALMTAVAWGVGGYFEKKGLHYGNMAPQMGITIRTLVALIILSAVSFPYWKSVVNAGPKSLLYIIIGGGVIAGAGGMLFFYIAIKGAPLSRVMPIAFTSPLFGALMGIALGGEPVSVKSLLGMAMTVCGIVLLTAG